MAETSLVLELQRYAQDDTCRISELLRRAKVVVVKLALTEARQWIDHEMVGYKPPSEVPDYRAIPCEFKLAHPRLGWVTLPWGQANPIQECLSSQRIRNPISELEEALSGSGPLCSNVTQKELDLLQMFGNAHLLQFPMARFYGKSSFAGILEAVRAKVLDLSLELERSGVLGIGMTFNDKEKSARVPQAWSENDRCSRSWRRPTLIAKVGNFGSRRVVQGGNDASYSKRAATADRGVVAECPLVRAVLFGRRA